MGTARDDDSPTVRRNWGRAVTLGVAGFFIYVVAIGVITGGTLSLLGAPYWLRILAVVAPALVVGALTMWGNLRLQLHEGRRRAGLCVACGYDLRGSLRRCPECGRIVPERKPRG